MTEEEIIKEHGQVITYVGQRVYQLCLPFIEIHEALRRVLALNQEMYKIKESKKKEEVPIEPGAAL